MINILKKYIPMIISVLFFFVYSGLLRFVFMENINEETINFYIYMAITLSIIIIFIIELVYFIIKAATNKNMKDNALWAVLIYIFNVFIIPYYNFKYIVKSKKIKQDMIIYIVLSILAIIIGFITPPVIFNTLKDPEISTLYLEENNVKFKFIGNYKEQENVGEYDLYVSDYNRQINIGVFIYDEEYDVNFDQIQQLNSSYIMSSRRNTELIDKYSKKTEDRNIVSEVIYGEYQGTGMIYKISTIEFKEYDYIINLIMITLNEDYDNYKEELEQFLLDVSVVE